MLAGLYLIAKDKNARSEKLETLQRCKKRKPNDGSLAYTIARCILTRLTRIKLDNDVVLKVTKVWTFP